MYCSNCQKKLKEPQANCCGLEYIRRIDNALVIVDRHTADIRVSNKGTK